MNNEQLESLELELLFKALDEKYDYDFRKYAPESARRRVRQRVREEGLSSISQLMHKVLHEEDAAEALLKQLSINVTEMFRDPMFYQSIRKHVLPWLKQLGHFKIWHAGCATGQEPYSMAIMLKEAGIYEHARIYATDFNNAALEVAKNGIYSLRDMQTYSTNYLVAGGQHSLSDYYYANYDAALIDADLKKNILFSNHNLAKDAGLNDIQLIVCRNVIIYFDHDLQHNVLQTFTNNLSEGGYLCLGSHESLQLTGHQKDYETIDAEQRIFRKIS